jgi:GAF domain-containing protein
VPNPDLHPALNAVAAALAQPGQPEGVYRAIDQATAALIGFKLITMMTYDADEGTVGRVYSNQPAAYPVGGKKPYSASTLFDTLLKERRPVVLRDAADVKRAFVDHALIASLGCDSGMFLPVAYDNRTLGVLNFAHQAHWYDDSHVALAAPFAALLTTPFLIALRGRS